MIKITAPTTDGTTIVIVLSTNRHHCHCHQNHHFCYMKNNDKKIKCQALLGVKFCSPVYAFAGCSKVTPFSEKKPVQTCHVTRKRRTKNLANKKIRP